MSKCSFISSLELLNSFVGCSTCAVISMASKRDILFATQYYDCDDCFEYIHKKGCLWILSTLDECNASVKCPLVTLHFLMMSKYPSFPVASSSFWNGAVASGLFCARGLDGPS